MIRAHRPHLLNLDLDFLTISMYATSLSPRTLLTSNLFSPLKDFHRLSPLTPHPSPDPNQIPINASHLRCASTQGQGCGTDLSNAWLFMMPVC